MPSVTIPDWNARGVLPPINPASPTSFDRSPYQASLTDVILRYATSPNRKTILDGFLRFRAALHAAGFVQGFQWLDGSFLEDIELIEGRGPHDLDVVTFYHLAPGQTQTNVLAASPALFQSQATKRTYMVDAYFVQLNQSMSEPLVRDSIYWYSLWSHRKNEVWKGYLQVDLAPVEDAAARKSLDATHVQPGVPS
jgi:hypothetical protein